MNLVLLDDGDFVAADRVVLRGRRGAHVREVHRARPGRELVVGKLRGAVGRGVVTRLDGDELELAVVLERAPPPKLPLTVVLALPRPKTLRRALQAVATLGVPRLLLVNSWRVEKSFWKSKALAPAAIERELRLGLEQGRDTIPPEVGLHRLLRPFCEKRLDALAAGSRRLVAHPDAKCDCPHAVAGPVTLLLGPEGGFIERELDLFARHGFEAVTLGPRPLRVEQALPALVARLAVASVA
jgi:RsmE family RNA methyltransferase